MLHSRTAAALCALLPLAALHLPAQQAPPDFVRGYLDEARGHLRSSAFVEARVAVQRALERDERHLGALVLLADIAERQGDRDTSVHALHRWLDVFDGRQGAQDKKRRRAVLDRLLLVDAQAEAWEKLQRRYVDSLLGLGRQYRAKKDLLGALDIYQVVLLIAPDHAVARRAIRSIRQTGGREVAIEDVYAGGDPGRGLSEQEIAAMDREHSDWDDAYTSATDNYRYRTNAGFLVLETSAIAMEQMNRFYRRFFKFKEDGGKTPAIEIRIFKSRDEYLTLGRSPAPWSAGHFIGSAVETYAGGVNGKASVRDMYRTLFHEAAHQFVSMTGPMVPGWLNEAYASFFEGCVILSNGTVKWNQAPPGRLFPLARRLQAGWMTRADIPAPLSAEEWPSPDKAPPFRLVVEGDYQWGPPWYAPTWGVVYFLYNYRHEDGRLVYRDALHEYYRSFKRGRPKDPVAHFEESLLHAAELSPVREIDGLDEIWKSWILRLRDLETGKIDVGDDLQRFARAALERGDEQMALELLEEARELRPGNVELLWQLAELLEQLGNKPLAAARYREFSRSLELLGGTGDERYARAKRKIERLDPLIKRYRTTRGTLSKQGLELARDYESRQLPTMALEIARRMTASFSIPEALDYYIDLATRTGVSLARWRVAYDERSLRGWSASDAVFQAYGKIVRAAVPPDGDRMVTRELTCDVTFDADFSLSAEMQILERQGEYEGRLVGLCFGRKGENQCHAVLLHPRGFLDISTNRGGEWTVHDHRSLPVGGSWHTLRIDVTGGNLDVYFDGLYVRSLEFPDAASVRGGFGLICGPGKARYRNIRLLERDPFDPAARIERDLAMARVMGNPSQRTRGSFTGLVSPELGELEWQQGEAVTLGELRGRPVMLVFWGPSADRVIPCASYFEQLQRRGAEHGLCSVVLCDPGTTAQALAAFIADKPMPSVRIAIDREGATYDAFFVKPGFFGMPRVLLLDEHGVVQFEGDPGLEAGRGWVAGDGPTYVDAALDELLGR